MLIWSIFFSSSFSIFTNDCDSVWNALSPTVSKVCLSFSPCNEWKEQAILPFQDIPAQQWVVFFAESPAEKVHCFSDFKKKVFNLFSGALKSLNENLQMTSSSSQFSHHTSIVLLPALGTEEWLLRLAPKSFTFLFLYWNWISKKKFHFIQSAAARWPGKRTTTPYMLCVYTIFLKGKKREGERRRLLSGRRNPPTHTQTKPRAPYRDPLSTRELLPVRLEQFSFPTRRFLVPRSNERDEWASSRISPFDVIFFSVESTISRWLSIPPSWRKEEKKKP